MFQKRQKVNIDDTRFIFQTNFSGDPTRDRFGSDKRRVNIVIPTVEQAMDMKAMGINVKETHPNPNYTYDEPFVPTYYVPVTVNVDSKWPPHLRHRAVLRHSEPDPLRPVRSRREAGADGKSEETAVIQHVHSRSPHALENRLFVCR